MKSRESGLSLPTWLDVLRSAMPPRGTLLVGAGSGNGPWVQWLQGRGVSPVWAVEGDGAQYQHLLRSVPSNGGWTPRRDVVAASEEAATFYAASNPAESGLLEPEQLARLWPNLTTRQAARAEAPVTLDVLLSDAGSDINWLILDCLPADVLLQGGPELLPQLDVVLVRLVADAEAGAPFTNADAADTLLRAAGLTCVHHEPERHPALVHALYVRDIARQSTELKRAGAAVQEREAELHTSRESWQREKQALTETRERESREAADQRAALEKSLATLKAEVQAERESWNQQRKALEDARDQATKRADDGHAQIAALERRIREQEGVTAEVQKRATELQAQKEALQREKESLVQARDQATKRADERHAQILALEKRIRDLQAFSAENGPKAELAQSELDKAQEQLSLIKELLFLEPKR